MKYGHDVKNFYALCNGVINSIVKDKCSFIISVKFFI